MFGTAIAYAANGTPAGGAAPGGILGGLAPFVLIFIVFYFILIRPQQKKAREHQDFLKNLQKGDSVVTNGGLYGDVTGLTDRVVTLEIAEKVRVKVSRQHILGSAAGLAASGEEAAKKNGGG